LEDICGYELPTNLQNFTQKDLTEVKIFQKVFFWGGTFLKHPVHLSVHSVQVRVVGEAVSFIDMLMIEL